MSPRKPVSVDPELAKLRKLKREPAPTLFTLLVDQDKLDRKPELRFITEPSFADCECSCDHALKRFHPSKNVISDGVFSFSIMCSTKAGVKRIVGLYEEMGKLESLTESTSRQGARKSLVFRFAGQCEHKKILRSLVDRTHRFVPFPVIPKFRLDQDGVPIMKADSDSDAEDEEPDRSAFSNEQAIYPWTTIINNALVEKLEQKLPRNPRGPTSEMAGYIYLLKSHRIADMLKIGVTTKNPAVRREQWDRCYPSIQLHAYTSLVPHARLIEHLIHTELLVQRHKEDCSNCKGSKTRARSHTEWFKVTDSLAEQTVIRWARWMGSRPFHTDTRMLSLTWLNRLHKAREKAYRPAVDHFLSKENTWQHFTDMPRPKDARDDSGVVELIRCTIGKSPFSA